MQNIILQKNNKHYANILYIFDHILLTVINVILITQY